MKKALFVIFLSFIVLAGMVLFEVLKFNDGKLHVVFCNVGQGDGIFIRTPSGLNIINDGGPDNSILSCISNHMPFWDRTINVMILTHPHADHITGLIPVLQSYTVNHFYTEKLSNNTALFSELEKVLSEKGMKTTYVYAGDSVKTPDNVRLTFVGPSLGFLEQTSPNGSIKENKEFASLITNLVYGKFSTLLTGDTQADELSQSLGLVRQNLSVLQVPHHGSATGLSSEILEYLKPQLGVISVGKLNRYGHPTPQTLTLLKESATKYFRTDQNGEVEIVSDGTSWKINP